MIRFPIFPSAALSLMLLIPSSLLGETLQIGIVGDSLGTGGAVHPDLFFEEQPLFQILSGQRPLVARSEDIAQIKAAGFSTGDTLEPPVRLSPSRHEFDNGINWIGKHVVNGFSTRFLDFEEYSWGYLSGLGLKVAPAQIFIAAEDGARMQALPRQFDRLLDSSERLPDHIFVFFTGNDVCGPSVDFVTSAEDYADALERGLKYLVRNGKPAVSGSQIWVMDPVSVTQLVTSPSILNKQVRAHGRTMSCRELQQYQSKPGAIAAGDKTTVNPEELYFLQFFPKTPADYCPTVFGRGFDRNPAEVQTTIANRIREYRQEIGNVMKRLNASAKDNQRFKGFTFHHVQETGLLAFEGADIAQDCFHLALPGQMKVAHALLKAIGAQPPTP